MSTLQPFPRLMTVVLTLFFTIMALVVGMAYARRSGNTGLDMAKIHLIRQKDIAEREN